MSEGGTRLVIVGRGIAGAMAAVHIARSFPQSAANITVIASADEAPDPFGEIETSLPGFAHWNAQFGIDALERDIGSERGTIVAALQSEFRAAAAREQELVDQAVGLEARVEPVRGRPPPLPGLAENGP